MKVKLTVSPIDTQIDICWASMRGSTAEKECMYQPAHVLTWQAGTRTFFMLDP